MPTISTVRGEIEPERLGLTSMHEHLNTDLELLTVVARIFGAATPPAEQLTLASENLAFLRDGNAIFSTESMTIGDVEYTATELRHFKAIGGGAVVDASPIGLRGDVADLRAASEAADVHVVTATGLYTALARPAAYEGWTEDQQVELFLRETTQGIEGTDVRAGILKCALSASSPDERLDEIETTTLRACARVAAETGLSVHVHSAFPMSGEQVLAGVDLLIGEMGLAPDRLVMMHLDSHLRSWDSRGEYIASIETAKSIDTSFIEQVLDLGVNVGFDSWGGTVEILPQDDDRLKGLVHLVSRGYENQIVLGHDVTSKPQGVSYGSTGFTWFPRLVRETFAMVGVPGAVFTKLTVDNPARILAR